MQEGMALSRTFELAEAFQCSDAGYQDRSPQWLVSSVSSDARPNLPS